MMGIRKLISAYYCSIYRLFLRRRGIILPLYHPSPPQQHIIP